MIGNKNKKNSRLSNNYLCFLDKRGKYYAQKSIKKKTKNC